MREVKHYVCEFCKTEYKDENDARYCEKGHKTPTEICQALYAPVYEFPFGDPQKIEVKMSDGTKVWFRRC